LLVTLIEHPSEKALIYMPSSSELPSELWLQVFEKLNSHSRLVYGLDYDWFQPRFGTLVSLHRTTHRINLTIALVSKTWLRLIRPWIDKHLSIGCESTINRSSLVLCMCNYPRDSLWLKYLLFCRLHLAIPANHHSTFSCP
jgi:hypothetical protein